MNLSLNGDLTAGRVASNARVAAESWAEDSLYCPNCSSPRLKRLAQNTQPDEFACPSCYFRFQLKSQRGRLGNSPAAGVYKDLLHALQRDEAPSFYFLHYDADTLAVRNLLLVPHFAIPPSAVVKRKGGAGGRFALDRIPADARIAIVTTIKASAKGDTECVMISRPEEVREKFRRLKPLADLPAKQRALALDVLNIVKQITGKSGGQGTDRPAFENADVYAFERELGRHYAGGHNLRDRIRQQLNALRRMGFLTQLERGVWRVSKS